MRNDVSAGRLDLLAYEPIYASIATDGGDRIVDAKQMQPFVDFARLAVTGEKFFLVSYSQLPIDAYASTSETAHHLLKQVGMAEKRIASRRNEDEFAAHSAAIRRGMVLLSFPGSDGQAHLMHLRHIARLWESLKHRRNGTGDGELSVSETDHGSEQSRAFVE